MSDVIGGFMMNEKTQKGLVVIKSAGKSAWQAFLSASTKRKIAIIAVAFVMVVFTVDMFDGTNEGNPVIQSEVVAPALKYSDFAALLESTPIDSVKCGVLKENLANSPSLKIATKYFAAAKGASDKLTPWNASEFASKTSWMKPTPNLLQDHSNLIHQTSDPILAQRVSDLNQVEAAESFKAKPELWNESFISFTLVSCELGDFASDALDTIGGFQASKLSIEFLAASKPWYPEGFEETSFAGFAYKNVSNQGCSYSFGSCAKFRIVSQTDCPSNLYVKTNSLDNGTVVDWSNDTAVVRAGQVALMETTFTSEAGNQWEFVEIECY